jgi:hypothetical protein
VHGHEVDPAQQGRCARDAGLRPGCAGAAGGLRGPGRAGPGRALPAAARADSSAPATSAARQILEITDELRLCAVVHAADDREWHQVYDHFASRDYTGAIAFPASRSREPSRELPKNRVAATAYLEENGLSSPGCRRALSLPCRGGPSLVPVAWFTLICLLPARPVLAPR